MMQAPNQSIDRLAIKNVGQLAIWTIAWVATLALAMFGPKFFWDDNVVASWIAIIVNVLAGVGWIVAHARYLRGVDELQRKIMLDAIAVALGVGLVGGCALSAAATADLIAFEADLSIVTIAMAIVYIVGIAVGTVRYR